MFARSLELPAGRERKRNARRAGEEQKSIPVEGGIGLEYRALSCWPLSLAHLGRVVERRAPRGRTHERRAISLSQKSERRLS